MTRFRHFLFKFLILRYAIVLSTTTDDLSCKLVACQLNIVAVATSVTLNTHFTLCQKVQYYYF